MDEPDIEPDAIDVFLLGARLALLAVAVVTFLVSLGLVVAEFITGLDLVSPAPFVNVVLLIVANRLLVTKRARARLVSLTMQRASR